MTKLIKTIDRFIEAGILLIIFLVPVYFAFLYKDFSVFSLDKVVVFRILVEILLIAGILKLIIFKEFFIYVKKKYLWIMILFFTAIIISFLFSIDLRTSFWGSYWRQQGLFTYFHYFFFFVILISNVDKKEKIEKIINVILFSSIIVTCYGLIQWFGLDKFSWAGKIEPLTGRITSTFGQPVFLANYLLLIIPLTFYKIIWHKNFLSRFFLILLLALQIFTLFITQSRGAWISFLFGIFFIFILLFFTALKQKKNIIIVIFSLFIISLFIFSVFIATNDFNYNNNAFSHRLKSITDIKAGSIAMRIKYWNAGLDAISKSFLFGYGMENQRQILAEYYAPDWGIYEAVNSTPDRAHNEYLDILLSGGILMLTMYIMVLFFIFYKSIKIIRGPTENNLLLFLIVSLFTYYFSLLFNFSTIETNVYLFLYIAIIFIVINNYKKESLINLNNFKKQYSIIFFYGSFLIIIGSFCLVWGNINSVRADISFRQARISYSNKDYGRMFEYYVKALNLNSNEEHYRWYYVNDSIDSFSKIKNKDYRESVLDYAEKILEFDQGRPENIPRLLRKAKVFTALGQYKNEDYYKEAEKEYIKLMMINPYLPETYSAWGQMYVFKEDYEKAILIYKKALSIMPDIESPYINQDHKEDVYEYLEPFYQNIAFSYIKLKDYDSALENYFKLIKINPFRLDIYKQIANTYYEKGDLDAAIWYNKRGYMLNPKDYSWPYSIALLYEEQGDKEEMLKYAKEALYLVPENNRVINFINSIK